MPDLGHDPQPPPDATLAVLVVDDEPAIAQLMCGLLGRRGYRVHAAHSAHEARAVIDATPDIGVILSDIRMPQTTGVALAGDLMRGRGEGMAVEVILVTGDISTEDAVGALRARVFDVLKKPFRLAHVVDVVDRALASARERRRRATREADLRERMLSAEAEGHRLADRLAQSTARLEDTRSTLAVVERARGDLFAVISHELRTPLIPILGFSEIIARSDNLGRDEVRSYAAMIHEGGNDLLALIEAVLDILALDQGEGLGPATAAPVADLVASAVGRSAALATTRGVEVALSGAGAPGIMGDQSRLAQALHELIDNAIKASPPGATVWVAWGGAAELAVSVLDRGPGVPDTVLDRLGTPFVQGDMTTTRGWPGAGLGLALVSRIALAHGGRFALTPRPGGGTEAVLTLPGLV